MRSRIAEIGEVVHRASVCLIQKSSVIEIIATYHDVVFSIIIGRYVVDVVEVYKDIR